MARTDEERAASAKARVQQNRAKQLLSKPRLQQASAHRACRNAGCWLMAYGIRLSVQGEGFESLRVL